MFNDVNDGKCDMAVVVVRPKGVGGTEGGRGWERVEEVNLLRVTNFNFVSYTNE